VSLRKFRLCLGIVAGLAAPVWADGHEPCIIGGEGPRPESVSFLPDDRHEFEGDRPHTGKWLTEWPPYGGQSFRARNVTAADGTLRLTAGEI
jgi:hypothetical protein